MFNYDEAIQKLKEFSKSNELTLDKLEDLIHQISIEDPVASENATTILYSGMINDKTHTSSVIQALVDDNATNVRVIDRTHVGKFLMSDDYKNAVKLAYQNTYPDIKPKDLEKALGDYLYGGNTNGTTGPWAEASRRFAQYIKGKVMCIVPNASATRTWAMVEMPNILNNPNVTSINGIPKELFQREWNKLMATADLGNLHKDPNFNKLLEINY